MQAIHLLEVVYFKFGIKKVSLRARSMWVQHFVWFAVERVKVDPHQVQEDLTVKLKQQHQHLQLRADAVHLFAVAVYGQFAWKLSLCRTSLYR